jgi:TetR/AcrR family fatty acid metabolism transcriptional regulator
MEKSLGKAAGVPPRKRRPQEREAEILSAARQLLEERGLVGATMADVALVAGVSEATIFNYFATRRDLIDRVLTDWLEPIFDRLEVDLADVQGLNTRLTILVARLLKEMTKSQGMQRLIYREFDWGSHSGSKIFELGQRYARLVTWIVTEGKQEKEVVLSTDPDIFRALLIGSIHQIIGRKMFSDRPLDMKTVSNQLADQLCSAIKVPEPAGAAVERSDLAAAIERLEAVAHRLEQTGSAQPQAER